MSYYFMLALYYHQNFRVTKIRKYQEHVLQPVEIGDVVWLGGNVTICQGVNIAPEINVGAGAVVSKNSDKEGWLYGGVPAKPIKPLYK